MKRILFFGCCSLIMAACNQSDTKASVNSDSLSNNAGASDSASLTSVQWIDSTFQNIGKVAEGQVVEVTYRFKNVGEKPLIVSNVRAGCGCTVAEKPEEPIAPGEESRITAKFNSKGQSVGEHQKDVYMTANTKPTPSQTLTFKVEVIK
ncbi:MAG TPA: DUF1573 domain-containing protein [Chitinophagaceae bacterium]|jgi:Protein of unknown function (DUF1573).